MSPSLLFSSFWRKQQLLSALQSGSCTSHEGPTGSSDLLLQQDELRAISSTFGCGLSCPPFNPPQLINTLPRGQVSILWSTALCDPWKTCTKFFRKISTPETLCSQNRKKNNESKWRIIAPNPAFVSSKLLSAYRLNLCFYAPGFLQHHLYFHFLYASEWANHRKHCSELQLTSWHSNSLLMSSLQGSSSSSYKHYYGY